MADAATEQRPDGADVAPTEAQRQAVAPVLDAAQPADELESSLQEFTAATARSAGQPDRPTDQSAGAAPQATGDSIDQLLAEITQQQSGPTSSALFTHGADAHEQARAQEQFGALQNENAQLRAHMQREADQADFDKLTGGLQAKLPEYLPSDYARTQLLAAAAQNPNLVAAFDLRHVDRRAAEVEMRKVEAELQRLSRDPAANQQQVANLQQYSYRLGLALNSREILRRAVREVERRGQAHKPIDETATAEHDAVVAAVKGASGKAQPEPPPNFGQMSDKEFNRWTRTNLGF